MTSVKLTTLIAALMVCAFESNCRAQTSTEGLQKNLTLPQRFTLRYKVVWRDISSKEFRQYLVDYDHKINSFLVKDKKLTQVQADDKARTRERGFQNLHPTQEYTITLSSQGNKFFMSQEKGKTLEVFVYNGTTSLEYGRQGTVGAGILRSDLSALSTKVFPLPGAGFSFLPLLKDIKTPTLPTADGKFQLIGQSPQLRTPPSALFAYSTSQLDIEKTQGDFKVLQCTVGSGNQISQKWDYSKSIPFQGIQLASQINFTDYQGMEKNGKPITVPASDVSFQLLDAKTESVPDKYFDLMTWLRPKDSVQDSRNNSEKDINGKPVAFILTKDGGPLEKQITGARWEIAHNSALKTNGYTKGSQWSGFLLLMGLVCGAGAWLWRKRQKV